MNAIEIRAEPVGQPFGEGELHRQNARLAVHGEMAIRIVDLSRDHFAVRRGRREEDDKEIGAFNLALNLFRPVYSDAHCLIDEWFMASFFQHMMESKCQRLVWFDVALIADEDLGRAGCRGRRGTDCGLGTVVIVDILDDLVTTNDVGTHCDFGGIDAYTARLIRRVRLSRWLLARIDGLLRSTWRGRRVIGRHDAILHDKRLMTVISLM